jgi:hypothetical protein
MTDTTGRERESLLDDVAWRAERNAQRLRDGGAPPAPRRIPAYTRADYDRARALAEELRAERHQRKRIIIDPMREALARELSHENDRRAAEDHWVRDPGEELSA